jgi:hypothetical protein
MKQGILVENDGRFEVIVDGEVVFSRSTRSNAVTSAKNLDISLLSTTPESSYVPMIDKPHFSINARFGFYENFLGMVMDGVNNSIVVSGKGGLGKSFTLQKMLDKKGLEEDIDYTIIKGYSTAKAMYRTLFENNGKIVIFDDCDSVLQDKVSLNILKGALDSYEKRIIHWNSEGFGGDDDLPSCFEFKGQVIFISNMERSKINQAILSRSLNVDLSMTKSEAIERMWTILPDILTEYSISIKEDALNFLEENQQIVKDLNMRTLLDVTKVRANIPENWEDAAKYLVMQ